MSRHPDVPFRPAGFPFFYGWIVVGAGMVGTLMSIPGQTIGVSVFTDFLIEALAVSRVQISLAYLIGTSLSAAILAWGGRLYDRYGARPVATAAALGLAGMLVYLSFVADPAGLFAGAAAPAVLGISISFGFSISPRLLEALIGGFGWQGAWRVLALVVGPAFAVVALVFFRNASRSTTAFTFHVISIFENAGFDRTTAVGIFLPISIIAMSLQFVASSLSDYFKLKYFALIHLLSLFAMLAFLAFLPSGAPLWGARARTHGKHRHVWDHREHHLGAVLRETASRSDQWVRDGVPGRWQRRRAGSSCSCCGWTSRPAVRVKVLLDRCSANGASLSRRLAALVVSRPS